MSWPLVLGIGALAYLAVKGTEASKENKIANTGPPIPANFGTMTKEDCEKAFKALPPSVFAALETAVKNSLAVKGKFDKAGLLKFADVLDSGGYKAQAYCLRQMAVEMEKLVNALGDKGIFTPDSGLPSVPNYGPTPMTSPTGTQAYAQKIIGTYGNK